jgi:hypothetical protein
MIHAARRHAAWRGPGLDNRYTVARMTSLAHGGDAEDDRQEEDE